MLTRPGKLVLLISTLRCMLVFQLHVAVCQANREAKEEGEEEGEEEEVKTKNAPSKRKKMKLQMKLTS
jgi:hypothetical protein